MDLDLMILGRTGSCKSSSGNSILGHTAFKVMSTPLSVTVFSKKDVAQLENGRKIQVVDTPGVGDTELSDKVGMRMFLTAVNEAILMCPRGYHAILFTLRYGGRFTKGDEGVLQQLKQVFGENFIKDHCIVLITCGDMFRMDNNMCFHDWCKEQRGSFKKLYEEVNGRVILFDNKGDNNAEETQRNELIKMVDSLGGSPYTNEKFQEAQKAFQITMRKRGIDTRCQAVRDGTSLILAQIEKFEKMEDLDEKTNHLSKLREQIKAQLSFICTLANTPWLQQAVTYSKRARDCVDKEICLISVRKDLGQKRANPAGNLPEEIARLETMTGELQQELTNAKKKLEEDSQKWRDDTNNYWLKLVSDSVWWYNMCIMS